MKYIKFREKIKFSEQGVIDCFIVDGDICENGGRIYYIYDFLKNYYPMLEEDYPYISINETSITQFCKYNLSKTVNITEPVLYYLNPNEKTGYVDAYTLAYYVYYYGPVVTMVNGDCDNFLFILDIQNMLFRKIHIATLQILTMQWLLLDGASVLQGNYIGLLEIVGVKYGEIMDMLIYLVVLIVLELRLFLNLLLTI